MPVFYCHSYYESTSCNANYKCSIVELGQGIYITEVANYASIVVNICEFYLYMDRSWYLDIAIQSCIPTRVLSVALPLRQRWFQPKLPVASALYQWMPNWGYCLVPHLDDRHHWPTPRQLRTSMAKGTTLRVKQLYENNRNYITVVSHDNFDISNHQRLACLSNSLLTWQQNISKVRIIVPCDNDSLIIDGFAS